MTKKHFIFCLLFTASTSLISQNKNTIEGTFKGVFKHNQFEIDLRFDIERTTKGQQVWFTSLQQNAYRIPTRSVSLINDSIKFILQSDFYTYAFSNIYDRNTNSLHGILTIDSLSFPFELQKVKQEEQIQTKEINFYSNSNKLFGTIWEPVRSNGQALFFVTSSGLTDRSSSAAEAYYFSQKGFTVFHFDKRGTGKSTGTLNNATIASLAQDDIMAIKTFSESTKIPLNKITIIGSSQGGAKVPLILNQMPELKAGISVATPGCTLLESDLNFMMNRLRDQIPNQHLQEATNMQRNIFEYLAGQLSKTELQKIIQQNQTKAYFQYLWIPELTDEIHRGLSYTPIPHFEKLKHTILIIQGTADIVIPQSSAKNIETALQKGKNGNYKIITFSEATHSMTINNQNDFPYWSALHPDYLKTIEKWLTEIEDSN